MSSDDERDNEAIQIDPDDIQREKNKLKRYILTGNEKRGEELDDDQKKKYIKLRENIKNLTTELETPINEFNEENVNELKIKEDDYIVTFRLGLKKKSKSRSGRKKKSCTNRGTHRPTTPPENCNKGDEKIAYFHFPENNLKFRKFEVTVFPEQIKNKSWSEDKEKHFYWRMTPATFDQNEKEIEGSSKIKTWEKRMKKYAEETRKRIEGVPFLFAAIETKENNNGVIEEKTLDFVQDMRSDKYWIGIQKRENEYVFFRWHSAPKDLQSLLRQLRDRFFKDDGKKSYAISTPRKMVNKRIFDKEKRIERKVEDDFDYLMNKGNKPPEENQSSGQRNRRENDDVLANQAELSDEVGSNLSEDELTSSVNDRNFNNPNNDDQLGAFEDFLNDV